MAGVGGKRGRGPKVEVVHLKISKIRAEKYGLRKEPDKAVSRLSASVDKIGLLHPVVVQKRKDGKYDLVSGHVRFETLKRGEAATVPAVIIPAGDLEALQTALTENLARTGLKPLEKARALHRLEELGMQRKEIARLLGVTPSQITNLLALFELEPEVRKTIDRGELHFGHAKALLALKGRRKLQLEAFRAVRRMMKKGERASARRVESLVRSVKAKSEGADTGLNLSLPHGVDLRESRRSKRLVIDFEDLDDLRARLTEIVKANFPA